MDENLITFDTTIAYPAKRRGAKTGTTQPRIEFTVPCHQALLPFLGATPPQAVRCYYNNLRCKYGELTRGTPVRIVAIVERGARGGVMLHIKQLDLTAPSVPDLTKVNAKMMKKWTKTFEKQHASR